MMVESIAIVTLNIVSIIFIKIRGLRRRAMYLVINLAVADMLVGGISEVTFLYSMGDECNFWRYDVDGIWVDVLDCMEVLFVEVSLTNIVAISLERMHATFFSTEASRDQETDLRGNNCYSLGFNCGGISFCFNKRLLLQGLLILFINLF